MSHVHQVQPEQQHRLAEFLWQTGQKSHQCLSATDFIPGSTKLIDEVTESTIEVSLEGSKATCLAMLRRSVKLINTTGKSIHAT
jgi:hypothetical protein